MKEVPLQEWAKRLLEDQIERLAELRNANPRDQSFKLWRQTTLTVIQRLCSADLAPISAYAWTDPVTGTFYGTTARIFQTGEESSGNASTVTGGGTLGEPTVHFGRQWNMILT